MTDFLTVEDSLQFAAGIFNIIISNQLMIEHRLKPFWPL